MGVVPVLVQYRYCRPDIGPTLDQPESCLELLTPMVAKQSAQQPYHIGVVDICGLVQEKNVTPVR